MNEFPDVLSEQIASAAAEELKNSIDRSVLKEITWIRHTMEHPDWHLVEIPWEKTRDKNFRWNEAGAWVVEQFGLPGENFVTHPDEMKMQFLFKHEEHAILTILKWC